MTLKGSKAGRDTRVIAMTHGVFLSRLQSDPELGGVSAVLFDEAHERHLDSDLGLALADYRALPAHDGLWEAAAATAHDPLARLAVVPMVLEARGLDVTPAT